MGGRPRLPLHAARYRVKQAMSRTNVMALAGADRAVVRPRAALQGLANVKDFILRAPRAKTHSRAFASWRSTQDRIQLT